MLEETAPSDTPSGRVDATADATAKRLKHVLTVVAHEYSAASGIAVSELCETTELLPAPTGSGVLDSLELVEFLLRVEDRLQCSIIDRWDDEQDTTIGGLARRIVERVS